MLLPAVLVVIALAAPRYGADSRLPFPGDPAPPRYRHTVRADLVTLLRWAGRALSAR